MASTTPPTGARHCTVVGKAALSVRSPFFGEPLPTLAVGRQALHTSLAVFSGPHPSDATQIRGPGSVWCGPGASGR